MPAGAFSLDNSVSLFWIVHVVSVCFSLPRGRPLGTTRCRGGVRSGQLDATGASSLDYSFCAVSVRVVLRLEACPLLICS